MSDAATGRRVVIVGGGVSGLTAAYRVLRAGVACVLLEATERTGGKLRSVRREDGFVLEVGADAILTRKPWALELAREIGAGDRIVPIRRYPVGTFVLHRGRPVPMPEGLQLLVPSKAWPFVRSPLFTARGKVRALAERWVPQRRETTDESLASFVRRRLGQEMLETIAEPMLGGVYNGDAEQQSILATFPQFPAMEREHGSLMRGIKAAAANPREKSEEPPFFSFIGGTEELAEALHRKVESLGGEIRKGVEATRVVRTGERFAVRAEGGDEFGAGAVIVATPAAVAGRLLAEVAPGSSAGLGTLRQTSIGTVYFAYRREQVGHALNGYGVVVPRTDGRPYDGMMWSASKWPHRAPEGFVLVRLFFGGPATRGVLAWSDAEVTQRLRAEVASALGVSGDPVWSDLYRWNDGYPQYDVGHIERVAAIRAGLPRGVLVTGAAYGGVGVPDCVRQAGEAATAALAAVGPCG